MRDPLRGLLLILCVALLFPVHLAGDVSLNSSSLTWRFATGGRIRSRPAVGADGTIYVLSEDRFLYALNPQGEMVWRFNLKKRAGDSLSIGPDGSVYVGLTNGSLVAVNPVGKEIWQFMLDSAPLGNAVVSKEGFIYIGSASGSFYALTYKGERRWQISLPSPLLSAAVLDEQQLYLSCLDNSLYVLNPWGEVVWKHTFSSQPLSPALDKDGTLFVATRGGELVSFSPQGEVISRYSSGFVLPGDSSPVLGNESVYLTTENGKVLNIDKSGSLLWEVDLKQRLVGSCALGESLSLYVVSQKGELLKLSSLGGISLVFAAETRLKSPLLAGSGQIYEGGDDWLVYAVGAEKPANSPWPQLERDSRHSNRSPGKTSLPIDRIYKNSMDYQYLKQLAASARLKDKEEALTIIKTRIRHGGLGKSEPYVLDILSFLIQEGLTRLEYDSKHLENRYTQIRAQAAYLLGLCGNLSSRNSFLQLARYEYDSLVLSSVIDGLGKLKSDPDGEAVEIIAAKIMKNQGWPADDRIAQSFIVMFLSLYNYHGIIAHPAGIDALITIFKGDYSRSTRKMALQALDFIGR